MSRLFVCTLAMSMLLAGCGGGDGGDGKSGGSGSGGGAVDTSKPLEGKQLGKSSQLKGTWLAQDEGMYIGFEFMDDGKVLVTPFTAAFSGLNSGVMMKYDVIDGGRLTLTGPDGQTMVYTTTIKGDQMEVAVGAVLSDKGTQRFRRLPSGQTLAEGVKLQAEQEAKARQAKYEALQQFIKQDGLVIVAIGDAAPSPAAPPAVAVSVTSDGSKAWHDDKPPHLDLITLSPDLNESGSNPRIQAQYGPQVSPPTAQPRAGGTIAFDATDDGRYIAKVNYGNQPMQLELKRDADLHKAIIGRFDAELARIEGLKKPLVDALKDFAVIEGTAGVLNQNQPDSVDRLVLVRDEKTGRYAGEGTTANPNTRMVQPLAGINGVIEVINDKAMLMVSAYGRQYQLSLANGETGELAGGWFPAGQQNGRAVKMSIVESMDAATRAARNDAERKALTSLSGGDPFVGAVAVPANFLPQPIPVAFTLTSGANGAVTGTLTAPIVGGTYDVAGQVADTLAGPRLVLKVAALREGTVPHARNLEGSLRNRSFAFGVANASRAEGEPLRLTDGAHTLTQATEAGRAAVRKRLLDAMAGGLKVTMIHPDYGPDQPRMVFDINADADGKIAGASAGIKGRGDFHENSTLEGELKEVNGMPMLNVKILFPPPARQGAYRRIYFAELIAVPGDDGWTLSGPYVPDTNASARQYMAVKQVKP